MTPGHPATFERSALAEIAGELLGTAALVAVVFASGAARVQLGTGTAGGALVGSLALGLGYGLVLWTFGALSGAQTNPIISIVASAIGGQPWRSTLRRVIAQVVGASGSATAIAWLLPYTFARDPRAVSSNVVAEAAAAFGFVLVALGVAHRRDITVPVALGAFALASFWMTGHATAGNPLLSAAVLVVASGEHTASVDLLGVGLGTTFGSMLAVVAGMFIFPHAREAAAAFVFSPARGRS